jgi:hypothetical protein
MAALITKLVASIKNRKLDWTLVVLLTADVAMAVYNGLIQ